jgi:hypothetical protein
MLRPGFVEEWNSLDAQASGLPEGAALQGERHGLGRLQAVYEL